MQAISISRVHTDAQRTLNHGNAGISRDIQKMASEAKASKDKKHPDVCIYARPSCLHASRKYSVHMINLTLANIFTL